MVSRRFKKREPQSASDSRIPSRELPVGDGLTDETGEYEVIPPLAAWPNATGPGQPHPNC